MLKITAFLFPDVNHWNTSPGSFMNISTTKALLAAKHAIHNQKTESLLKRRKEAFHLGPKGKEIQSLTPKG